MPLSKSCSTGSRGQNSSIGAALELVSFKYSYLKNNNIVLTDWIKSLDKRAIIDELANQGWYLPFKNQYSQDKYNIKIEKNNYGPSKNCWENSWSFSPLNKEQRLSLENLWNQSLTP